MKQSVKDFAVKWQKPLLIIAAGIFVWPWYMVINFAQKSWGTVGYDLTLAIDQATPFIPLWQIVYASVYTFAVTPVFYIKDDEFFRRVVYAFCGIQIIAFVFFLFCPTQIERPVLDANNFINWTIVLNHSLDPPYNCIPSLHCANAFFVGLTVFAAGSFRWGVVTFTWGCLICLSTVFVKAHFWLDIVGGFAVAMICYMVFVHPMTKRDLPEEEVHRPNWTLGLSFAIFGLLVVGLYIGYLAGMPAKF